MRLGKAWAVPLMVLALLGVGHVPIANGDSRTVPLPAPSMPSTASDRVLVLNASYDGVAEEDPANAYASIFGASGTSLAYRLAAMSRGPTGSVAMLFRGSD